MANMEFLSQNLLNTTTMVTTTAGNGSGTVQYAFDRNIRLGYNTVGYTSNTATDFSITFTSAQVVNRVIIQNHNLKNFRIFVNSSTATAITYSSNSETSTYVSFGTLTVNSVQLELEEPMTADTEKRFGEIILLNRTLQFTVNPNSSDWDPVTRRKQIVHEMPDGGVRAFQVRDKFEAKLKFKFISSAFNTSLRGIHSSAAAQYFCPFPTTTGWDGVAHEVLWLGPFDFTYGEDSKTQGYNGTVHLRETAGG